MDFKKHSFWIGMGGAGAAILVFYVFFVLGAQGEASRLRGDLVAKKTDLSGKADLGPKLPNDAWATAKETYKKELEKQRAEVKKFYQSQGDGLIEAWFEELKGRVGSSGQPDVGTFKAQYKASMDKLAADLEAKKITLGAPKQPGKTPFGAAASGPAESPFELKVNDVTDNNMRALQKHYWIQKRLTDVMIQSHVVCFEKIDFRDEIVKKEAPVAGPGGAPAPRVASANELPRDLGNYIPFELTVHLLNSDLPNFLVNFLKFDNSKGQAVMMRVQSLKVRKTRTPQEDQKVNVERAELEKPDHKKPVAEPIPVKVVVIGEVLDFDISDKPAVPNQ